MHISATKMLVVEDSERFRRFIVSTLRRSGNFKITEASNGVEALQKAEELLPDLALLDIGLPDVSKIRNGRLFRCVSKTGAVWDEAVIRP